MQIKYVNTKEELIKSYDKNLKKFIKLECVKSAFVPIAFIIILNMYLIDMSDFYYVDKIYNIGMTVFFIIVYVVSILGQVRAYKIQINKVIENQIEYRFDMLKEKEVILEEEKIVVRSETTHSEYNLLAVDDIFEISNLVVIYVKNSTPLLVIPKSAFDSEDNMKVFINKVRAKSNYIK